MRYSGKLGLSRFVEASPGVWEEEITEVDVLGTLENQTSRVEMGGSIHPAFETTTTLEVFTLDIGEDDHFNIRYATRGSKRWLITSVVFEPPKMILRFGEEYNGPTPN